MKKQILTSIYLLGVFSICMTFCNSKKEPITKSLSDNKLKAQITFTGKIIFQSNFDGDNEIYLLSESGLEQLTNNTWQDEYPVWSPDGKKIAFTSNREGQYDIFTMNSEGEEVFSITSSPQDEKEPAWYPDGKKLAFTREAKKFLKKQTALYQIDINTHKTKKIIPQYSKAHGIANISPSASLITFTGKRTIGWDTAIYNIEENQVNFLNRGGKSCRARFSKDGKKLAYVSSINADGKSDIWIMKPDGSEKIRLTLRNDTYDYFPAWSPDGKHIVFNSSLQHNLNGDWQLYILDVKTGKANLLFDSTGNDIFPDWHQ